MVQELKFTFVLDNQGVRLFSINRCPANEALLMLQLLLGTFVSFTILLGSSVFPPHFEAHTRIMQKMLYVKAFFLDRLCLNDEKT